MGPHKADYKVRLHLTQYLWRLAAVGEMNYAAEFELRNADEELKLTCAVDELEPLLAHDEFGCVEAKVMTSLRLSLLLTVLRVLVMSRVLISKI